MYKDFNEFLAAVKTFCRYPPTQHQEKMAMCWWQESENCCPEAIACDIQQYEPDLAEMHKMTCSTWNN
jgi:hypothetical protein